MDERRKERRYPVRRDALVWDFPGGVFHHVVVEDVSRAGMQLQSEHRLVQGSQIAVDLKGMIVWGTVQYCRPLQDRFAAGIRINHVDDRTFEGVLSQRNAPVVYLGREGVLAKDLSRVIPALRKNIAARRTGMREGTADNQSAAGLMAARPQAIGGGGSPHRFGRGRAGVVAVPSPRGQQGSETAA